MANTTELSDIPLRFNNEKHVVIDPASLTGHPPYGHEVYVETEFIEQFDYAYAVKIGIIQSAKQYRVKFKIPLSNLNNIKQFNIGDEEVTTKLSIEGIVKANDDDASTLIKVLLRSDSITQTQWFLTATYSDENDNKNVHIRIDAKCLRPQLGTPLLWIGVDPCHVEDDTA
ncbi:hypothetical protein GJ496_005750 [Pomphorhynchus laevis]|nr:hypothetical protein GJ496_005750 [Pomphorhynchus laevis]